MKRSAFTMVELVFVIVIVGILAAIAIPRFAATRYDAE
ncbi:MAG: type II secretion system protein, partial [Sulfuricurvum sp.]|nr:type II secretion system protein [Sulfuricurvum sp.]